MREIDKALLPRDGRYDLRIESGWFQLYTGNSQHLLISTCSWEALLVVLNELHARGE